ncbi:hypothetical protein K438DRAFT_1766048 [Mycena galopus ATCC 62051]|nr:hypothetical protein K438DRAFT_1766048 [Mycena galopus ATCC 62051]
MFYCDVSELCLVKELANGYYDTCSHPESSSADDTSACSASRKIDFAKKEHAEAGENVPSVEYLLAFTWISQDSAALIATAVRHSIGVIANRRHRARKTTPRFSMSTRKQKDSLSKTAGSNLLGRMGLRSLSAVKLPRPGLVVRKYWLRNPESYMSEFMARPQLRAAGEVKPTNLSYPMSTSASADSEAFSSQLSMNEIVCSDLCENSMRQDEMRQAEMKVRAPGPLSSSEHARRPPATLRMFFLPPEPQTPELPLREIKISAQPAECEVEAVERELSVRRLLKSEFISSGAPVNVPQNRRVLNPFEWTATSSPNYAEELVPSAPQTQDPVHTARRWTPSYPYRPKLRRAQISDLARTGSRHDARREAICSHRSTLDAFISISSEITESSDLRPSANRVQTRCATRSDCGSPNAMHSVHTARRWTPSYPYRPKLRRAQISDLARTGSRHDARREAIVGPKMQCTVFTPLAVDVDVFIVSEITKRPDAVVGPSNKKTYNVRLRLVSDDGEDP